MELYDDFKKYEVSKSNIIKYNNIIKGLDLKYKTDDITSDILNNIPNLEYLNINPIQLNKYIHIIQKIKYLCINIYRWENIEIYIDEIKKFASSEYKLDNLIGLSILNYPLYGDLYEIIKKAKNISHLSFQGSLDSIVHLNLKNLNSITYRSSGYNDLHNYHRNECNSEYEKIKKYDIPYVKLLNFDDIKHLKINTDNDDVNEIIKKTKNLISLDIFTYYDSWGPGSSRCDDKVIIKLKKLQRLSVSYWSEDWENDCVVLIKSKKIKKLKLIQFAPSQKFDIFKKLKYLEISELYDHNILSNFTAIKKLILYQNITDKNMYFPEIKTLRKLYILNFKSSESTIYTIDISNLQNLDKILIVGHIDNINPVCKIIGCDLKKLKINDKIRKGINYSGNNYLYYKCN